jgi:hypothetical protein
MISRTSGTPIMEEIAIMKIVGRLFSNIEFITVVVLTAVALLVLVVVAGGDAPGAVGMMPEIPCKDFVALVNAAVVFSKELVAFSNLSLTICVAVVVVVVVLVVLLVDPPPVVVLFLRGSVAFTAAVEEVVATTASCEDKLSMNNRDTRMIAVTVFIYTLFVLFIVR